MEIRLRYAVADGSVVFPFGGSFACAFGVAFSRTDDVDTVRFSVARSLGFAVPFAFCGAVSRSVRDTLAYANDDESVPFAVAGSIANAFVFSVRFTVARSLSRTICCSFDVTTDDAAYERNVFTFSGRTRAVSMVVDFGGGDIGVLCFSGFGLPPPPGKGGVRVREGAHARSARV